MGDVVDGGSTFGEQNVYLCVTSHTSGTDILTDLFFSGNWQQLASATNLDDGHLLRYRGSWQQNTEYSGDPIVAGEGGGDDFDIETTKIPQRLNILICPKTPEVHSGPQEDALGLGIKIGIEEPILYNGPVQPTDADAVEGTKVEDALRKKMWSRGEPAPLGMALNLPYHPYPIVDGWTDGDPFPDLRSIADGRLVYFETDPDQEPKLAPKGEESKTTWALFIVRETARTQTDLAGRRFDVNGALIVDVFTEVIPLRPDLQTDEENPAMVSARKFAELYDSGTVLGDGIRLYMTGSRLNQIGVDGKWYRVRVEAPFRYYDTR